MKQRFLEAGKIVNTHGIRGEIKVQPWCDEPELLTQLETLYLDQRPVRVQRARVHKGCVLMQLEGIGDIDSAAALKNKILYLDREDVDLPEESVFIQDLLGMRVYDAFHGRQVGTLRAVLPLPAGDVYEIAEGDKTHLVPARAPFLQEIDEENGIIHICTIEGMIE